jgi:mono/diheme cytochrome c family protein
MGKLSLADARARARARRPVRTHNVTSASLPLSVSSVARARPTLRLPTPSTYIVPADMGLPLAIAALPLLVAVCILGLGVGVFLLAMRRPRDAGPPPGESRAAQRGLTAVIVLACAFGLVVPALVLAFNGEHRASAGVGGVHLNANQQKGRELFSHACNLCHTLAGAAAVGRTGPDLDVLIPTVAATLPEKERYAARKAFVLSAILEGRARGKGQMPKLLYQGTEAEDVAAFVAAVAGH